MGTSGKTALHGGGSAFRSFVVFGIVVSEKVVGERESGRMSEKTDDSVSAERHEVRLKKQIVAFEEATPEQEPLFINHAQVAQCGGSVYIDVGVIPLDELLQGSPEARFLVLTRLVMSTETLAGLRDQISAVLQGGE
jgi:hypothetical protein